MNNDSFFVLCQAHFTYVQFDMKHVKTNNMNKTININKQVGKINRYKNK